MSEAAAWVAAVVALAALIVSVLALRWAKVSAKAGRDSAASAAESLRWSRLSAEASHASAQTAVSAEAARAEATARSAVGWEIVNPNANMVGLRNVGRDPAYEVTLQLSPTSAAGNVVGLETVAEVLPSGIYWFDRSAHHQGGDWVRVLWQLTCEPASGQVRDEKLLLPDYMQPLY